ncbi:MAG: DUF2244 domain-containing protein [Betaproteobacteria bacterium]|nr:DUF2244 domain-containing protein [Betaproteobacteria bacterium]
MLGLMMPVSLGIALAFASIGEWMTLPIAGLDMLALAAALKRRFKATELARTG